jgi:hypothetical protein
MEVFIADKDYDANYMIEAAEQVNAKAMIPSRSKRKVLRKYDKDSYKEGNLIE